MKNLLNEVWKPVKGFEGLYEVSNNGNVRSLDRYVMCGSRCCLFKGKPKKIVSYPPVIQLDKSGKQIGTFKNCRAAAEELGFYTGENIRIAAKKGGKAYGYYWKFEKN